MSAPNRQPLSVDEALTRFHNRYAGGSHDVFGRALRPGGRTSYQWLADQSPSGAVLDLACGDGALSEILVRRGDRVVGLDRNAAELACARRRLPHTELLEGDARALPFAAASFDVVLSHMALMLIPDGDAVAAEVRRVLKPGGVFAGVVGAGLDRHNALVTQLMPALHTLLEEADLHIEYPGERWNGTDLAARLPGWQVIEDPTVLEQQVPLARFPAFVALHYYGVGLLEGPFRDRADQIARDIGAAHATHDHVRWSTQVRGFRAERPQ